MRKVAMMSEETQARSSEAVSAAAQLRLSGRVTWLPEIELVLSRDYMSMDGNGHVIPGSGEAKIRIAAERMKMTILQE